MNTWEEPKWEELLLLPDGRSVDIDSDTDTAAIVFPRGALRLPPNDLVLIEKDNSYLPGVQIGWLGFPDAVTRDIGAKPTLCFFSGHISAYLKGISAYLVDGVAIHGVSGGPAFVYDEALQPKVIGVVSAYCPNRETGAALPGVAIVRDVNRFHEHAEIPKLLEAAARKILVKKPC